MFCPHCDKEIEGMTTSECLVQTLGKPFMFSHFVKPPSELPDTLLEEVRQAIVEDLEGTSDYTSLDEVKRRYIEEDMAEGYVAMAEENREIVERFFPLAHDPSPEGLPDAPGSTRGL